MSKIVDLTGQRFGKLQVIEITDQRTKGHGVIWRCKCDCGNMVLVRGDSLIHQGKDSCGCGRREDITGQRYGNLVAIKFAYVDKKGRIKWIFRCDCGNEKAIRTDSVKEGKTTSCGCILSETAKEKAKNMQNIYSEKSLVEGTSLCKLKEKIYKNNTSGVKGVSWHSRDKKWQATISLKRKVIYLGQFNKLEDAITIRKEAEEKYFKPILEKYNIETE